MSPAIHRPRPRSPGSIPLLICLISLVACTGTPERDGWEVLMPTSRESETTRIAGPVTYMDLEGGLWVIRGPDGTNFHPTNLPEAYREDGLPIEAEVVRRDDVASIGMVGPIVDVVRIRRVDGEAAGGG